MSDIYLVIRVQGEYEDCTRTPIRAFSNKALAEAWRTAASAWADKTWGERPQGDDTTAHDFWVRGVEMALMDGSPWDPTLNKYNTYDVPHYRVTNVPWVD